MPILRAYVDESGQRANTPLSSPCFILAAAVFPEDREHAARELLARLRTDLARSPADTLHWKNFKQHGQRIRAAQLIGAVPWMTVSTVTVSKRHLRPDAPGIDEDLAYMWTFRLLLERLSWIARERHCTVDITLAHVRRFPTAKLREYEARLRAADTQVHWPAIHGPSSIDQPLRIEFLQLADICASATGAAFNPDRFNNTEDRYVRELSPRLYRRGSGTTCLTSYGLKIHPWNDTTQGCIPLGCATLKGRADRLLPDDWVPVFPQADDRPRKENLPRTYDDRNLSLTKRRIDQTEN